MPCTCGSATCSANQKCTTNTCTDEAVCASVDGKTATTGASACLCGTTPCTTGETCTSVANFCKAAAVPTPTPGAATTGEGEGGEGENAAFFLVALVLAIFA